MRPMFSHRQKNYIRGDLCVILYGFFTWMPKGIHIHLNVCKRTKPNWTNGSPNISVKFGHLSHIYTLLAWGDGRLVTSFPGSFVVALPMHIVKKGAVVYPWYTLDTGTFRHTLRSKIHGPSTTCSRVQWHEHCYNEVSRPDPERCARIDILSRIRFSWGLLFSGGKPAGCIRCIRRAFRRK